MTTTELDVHATGGTESRPAPAHFSDAAHAYLHELMSDILVMLDFAQDRGIAIPKELRTDIASLLGAGTVDEA